MATLPQLDRAVAGHALLEVASGSGGPAVRAAVETGCEVVGVDRHGEAAVTARRLAGDRAVSDCTRFMEADASLRLPFDDASFDAVTCIDSIHHLPDRDAVLAEWHRVLRPGGHLVYTDPIVVTGMLSNEEVAVRSSIGYFTFTPMRRTKRCSRAPGSTLSGVTTPPRTWRLWPGAGTWPGLSSATTWSSLR